MWKLKCRIGSYLYCLCSFGLIAQHANESILPSSGMQETTQQQAEYSVEEEYALKQDEHDPLSNMREKFHIPTRGGDQLIYLNGNSLGLQPCEVAADMKQELDDWASLGVEGHFKENDPWYTFHEQFSPLVAKIVGTNPGEVVFMNTLTVNLHLMMVSFYQPKGKRSKIIMEAPVFSSDTYAIKSQIQLHGLDPKTHLIIVEPAKGEKHITAGDIDQALKTHKGEVALVLLSSVNFLTGQAIDVPAISEVVHQHGAKLGLDLAHAIGNIPLKLHEWNVDFAAWCSYKYLNAGPGAVGGVFVHEKHTQNVNLKRLAGWWGNDPKLRFRMHLEKDFIPITTADGWQISNPPIFSMVPLKASLKLYDSIGMKAYREKSVKMTGYLEFLLDKMASKNIEIVTPRDPKHRGCQLSLLVHKNAKEFHEFLSKNGVICDFRQPNVIRVAPVPFYNSYHEIWRFAQIMKRYFEFY
jgi:kynureninase